MLRRVMECPIWLLSVRVGFRVPSFRWMLQFEKTALSVSLRLETDRSQTLLVGAQAIFLSFGRRRTNYRLETISKSVDLAQRSRPFGQPARQVFKRALENMSCYWKHEIQDSSTFPCYDGKNQVCSRCCVEVCAKETPRLFAACARSGHPTWPS